MSTQVSGALLMYKFTDGEFKFLKENISREIKRYEEVYKKDPKAIAQLEETQGIKTESLKKAFRAFDKIVNDVDEKNLIIIWMTNLQRRVVQRLCTVYFQRCILIIDEYNKRIEKATTEDERKRLEDYRDKVPIMQLFAKELFLKLEE